MRAEAKSVKEIFGGGPQKLVVPFFQRRYVWKEENWKELLESGSPGVSGFHYYQMGKEPGTVGGGYCGRAAETHHNFIADQSNL